MKNRRTRRRQRIIDEIIHYLYAHRYGEWVMNHDIVKYLEQSVRGKASYNKISVHTLGQYVKGIPQIQHKVIDGDGRKNVCYRIGDEEE